MNKTFIAYVCSIIGDTTYGLTGAQIGKEFTNFAFEFDKSIPYPDGQFRDTFGNLIVKREGLKSNLESFDDNEKYYIIDKLCKHPRLKDKEEVQKLHAKLISTYSSLNTISNSEDKIDFEIINETKHWLEDYPEALNKYQEAISKYELLSFERNVLDDIRLSLEMLLKEVFENDKSLENQKSNIGVLIKSKGGSNEYTQMFQTLMNHYTKYQNEYVKHNDKVNKTEIEFIIEITSLFMKNIIKFSKS